MKLVVLESPYAGAISDNARYARECMADSLKRGEAPIASHLLYTQPGILRDGLIEERVKGMQAGWAWHRVAELIVFYTDNGWSGGMLQALELVRKHHYPNEYRSLRGPTFIKAPPA